MPREFANLHSHYADRGREIAGGITSERFEKRKIKAAREGILYFFVSNRSETNVFLNSVDF